ncbi:LPD38 domain-containing protein [Aquipseudomonas campi]
MAGLFDDLSGGDAGQQSGGGLFGDLREKPKQNTSLLGDLGTDLKIGVQKLPGAVTGLADIVNPLTYITGQRMADKTADAIGEFTGFQPSKWAEESRDEYSPQRQAIDAEIDQAWDEDRYLDAAGGYIRNPSKIAGLVAESAPQMLAGGMAGRAAGAVGALSGAARAAVGEGAIMAGSAMDQIDREVEAPRAAAAALVTGVVGGSLSGFGARLAQRSGLLDIDSAIAGGVTQTATSAPGLARRVAGGALTEGVIEELPQSIQEQMLQNWAERKPLMDGVPRAAVEGTLAGSAIGGGVNVMPARTRSEQMGIDASEGPISAVAASAVDSTSSPVRDAARANLLDGAPTPQAGSKYQPINRQMAMAQELFPTDLDADGTLRYFRYDRDLQTMVEVPEADALAAAKMQIELAEREGFDPLDNRALDQLLPEVESESAPQGTGMAADDLTPYERNQLRALGMTDEQLASMTTSEARALGLPTVDIDSGPQVIEEVREQLPLPTVEMDTGPLPTEEIQAAPLAQPLGLPAPSTMVVDSDGVTRPGPTPPRVAPHKEKTGRGGPGMDQQASGRQRPNFEQLLQQARSRSGEDAAALAEATGATRIQAARAIRGVQAEQAATSTVFKSVPGASKAVRELPEPGGFEVVKSGNREWRVQRKQEVLGADRGRRAVDERVASNPPAAPVPADNVARVPVVADRPAPVRPAPGQDRADVSAATEGANGRRSLSAPKTIAGKKIDKDWTEFSGDSGSRGIPRAEMPQIKAEHRGAMVNFLNARGISHAEEAIAAADLKPTQAEFSPKKVAAAKKFAGGDRSILISRDGHVLDGHHQWMAMRDAGEDVKAIRLDAPIQDLLAAVAEFPSATQADGTTSAADSAGQLPSILATPRRRYIDRQAKAAGLKKGSPGYDQAVQRLQDQYEADVDRASAGITFEQFNALNSDSPEALNRQAWQALRQEFGQSYSRSSYRMAAPKAQGARAGQLRMAIKQMTSGWQNAPKVTVVQSIKDLPARLRQRVQRDGAFDVEGIFAGGQVYLVADNLTGARHAAFVMQHEVLGHAGLQGAYGHRLTPLLMSIYNGNADMKRQADALVQQFNYSPAVAMEEVLADMAGAGSIQQQPFWQRLVSAMRNTLRSIGMGVNWTEGDIQGLLANARRYIERGKPRQGARAAFSRDGKSARGLEIVDEQGRLLAPNGKPSELNQRQWHQSRSDKFKKWFGDWQAVSAMERLAGMAPVRIRVPNDWRDLSVEQLRAKAKQAMRDIVSSKEPLVNDAIGQVIVSNNTGARKFISGGADPAKLLLAADMREAFRKAVYSSSERPSNPAAEPNVQAYEKLHARVRIDSNDLVVVFTVQRNRDGRQFYNATTLEYGQKETPAVSPRDTPIAGERATSAYTGVSSSAESTEVQAFSRRELERVNPDTVSKVTDGNGEPMVVYHGTTADFDAFARESIGSNIDLPLDAPIGFYFAKSQDIAGRYAAGEGANVMPVFVSIKNPAPNFQAFNADQNYDGFINSKIVVARNPEQVKSATANVGTFDPGDSDIRYSRASQRDTEAMRKIGLGGSEAQNLLNQVRNITLGELQQKLKDWSIRSEEGLFDGLAGIKRAEEAVGVTDINQQGYVSARMASGIADTMHGILHYAAPEWRDGVVSGKAGTRGVLEVLGDLGPDNLTPWLAWLGGKRAELLAAQGRENNLTAAEIAELVAMGQGKEALFEKVYREYAQVNEAVLDLAQEAGLIDQDARAKWLTDYYVPFYRQDESEGIFSAPRSKRGLSHQTAAIKALKGGKLPTNDLLANMLSGWTKRVDAAMKNKALLEVVDNLKDSDYLQDESPRWQQVLISRDQIAQQIRKDRKALALAADLLDLPAGSNPIKVVNQLMKPENDGFEKLWTRVAPTDPDIIRVQRDGKSEYYRVNDESLLRGLKFMEGSVFNDPITKMGRAFKRILTTGVTASPDFILRNFIRDAAHAWVINKDGFTLGKDSIKGIRDALREDADYRDLMFAGGSFQGGYVHGTDPEASAQIIRRALEKKGYTRTQQDAYLGSMVNTPAKAAAMLGKGWQKYRELSDKVENSSRLSTYKASRAAGKTRREAAFEAKDLMDFSLRGNFAAAQWFTDVVPFLNARMQGLYKLGRAMKGDKTLIAKEVAMKGAYIALFSLMLAGINDDDERYQALQDWDKDMHWHIFLGDEHFRIPKPFELGLLFGTVPERMLHAITGTQDGGDLAKALSHGVFDTLAFNPVPQFYQPIRELQANRNFFRDSPIEDMSDEGKLAEARYDERTSFIGRTIGQVTGPLAGLSPKQVDHLIAAYTGTLGQYVLDMSSLVARSLDDGVQPASRPGDIPILKVLYQGDSPRSTKYQAEFYDMMREADQLHKTVKSYREEGRLDAAEQLMAQNREKLRHRPALGFARKQLGNIRNQMDSVYRDTAMTADQKRQRLDALQRQSNQVSERIVKLAGGDF